MEIGQNGLNLIKHYEGCRLTAYQDTVGIWTIGWGNVAPWVKRGVTITQEEADKLLDDRLKEEFIPGVLSAVHGAATTQNQLDAMVSLAYNIGVGGFQGSTVAKQHRLGNYQSAAEAFKLWNKAGGSYSEPHMQRRIKEANLYLTPDGGNLEIEPIMQQKMKKAIAIDMQIALKKHNLYKGALDGLWGPMSKAAYEDFLKLA